MNSVKVSVIIPVINQGNHISACLESVLGQTLKDIEVIVVEGGSTDNTSDIILRFMDKDPRIKLINKSNEGLPMARKAGLNFAKGEYILHLDGDDTLEHDALELLYGKAQECDADMVVLNFIVNHAYNGMEKESASMRFVRLSGIDFIRTLYLRQNYWMIWSVLHKRSLYSNFKIKFDSNLFLGEDALLTTQLAYFSKKIVKLNSKPVLKHYIRKAPEEKRRCFSQKSYFDLITYPRLIEDFLKDKLEYPQLKECIASLRLQSIIKCFTYRCFDSAKDRSTEALQILNEHPSLKIIYGKRMLRFFKICSLNESLGRILCKFML